jgi:hypothetical protein
MVSGYAYPQLRGLPHYGSSTEEVLKAAKDAGETDEHNGDTGDPAPSVAIDFIEDYAGQYSVSATKGVNGYADK